jgi:hypothetical protein
MINKLRKPKSTRGRSVDSQVPDLPNDTLGQVFPINRHFPIFRLLDAYQRLSAGQGGQVGLDRGDVKSDYGTLWPLLSHRDRPSEQGRREGVSLCR